MLAEETHQNLPEMVTDGLILVGDSAGLINSSIYHEVTNLAMASGVYAGETVVAAKEKGDYSKAALSAYRKKLDDSFVLKDMFHFRNVMHFLKNNKQFLNEYPDLFIELMGDYFAVSETPKLEVRRAIIKKFRQRVKMLPFLRDLWNARGAMI